MRRPSSVRPVSGLRRWQNVCLLALWGDSLTFTMTSAVAYCGHHVEVWIADEARDGQSKWSLSRCIAAIPRVRLVLGSQATAPESIDMLIVQGHPLMVGYQHLLERLAPRAACMTAVTAGDRSRPYRQSIQLQWRERRWYGRWFGKIGRVAYKDGYFPLDVMGLFRSRRVVGFDAHSKFLLDDALFKAIHAQDWKCEAIRPIRANFLGSRDPESRGRILDSVASFFQSSSSPAAATAGKRMFWHVYSDAQPAALGPEAFLGILSDSDFTLAPQGFSLVTHRPVEALLRGSIPVLNADELHLYDLGLADGVNCIAVPRGGWVAAMERIRCMDEEEVKGMRRNIRSMLADRVAYPALARDICRRLGLDG